MEVGGNETQFTLRELQPKQAYRLRIAAGTVVGFGLPSEWAQHQTLAHYNHSNQSMGKENASGSFPKNPVLFYLGIPQVF